MSTVKKTILALAALGASVALAPALHAQGTPAPGASPSQGMMGGGMMAGMGDMAGMVKMMENCNRMMQSMNQNPRNPSPEAPPATPEREG
jgi:hypothetical protein